MVAFEGETAAEILDAFAHAAQAIAFALDFVRTIVFDDEAAVVAFGDEAQTAGGGAGVAHDVGDGFAQGEGEGGLFGGGEMRGGGGIGVEDKGDACCVEGAAGGFDFGTEAAGAVAADGLADFCESGARDAFDVGDLGGGAVVVGGFVAIDEAAGELSFEDDDGEGVAENVVEIAGDAFAFGDGGEGEVFVLGFAELAIGAALLGEEDVATANDGHEKDGDEGVGPGEVEGSGLGVEKSSFCEDENHQAEIDGEDFAQRGEGEGEEGCGVDEEGGTALVPREGDEAESEGCGDHPEAGGKAFVRGADVAPHDEDEDEENGEGGEPENAARLEDGVDEEEAGVGKPDPCPLVPGFLRDGFGGRHEAFWKVYAERLGVLFETAEGDGRDAEHHEGKAEEAKPMADRTAGTRIAEDAE